VVEWQPPKLALPTLYIPHFSWHLTVHFLDLEPFHYLSYTASILSFTLISVEEDATEACDLDIQSLESQIAQASDNQARASRVSLVTLARSHAHISFFPKRSQPIYYQENQNYVPRKHRLLLHLLLHNRMLIPDHNLLSRELFPKKPEIISSVWEILTRIKKGYLVAIVLGLRYVFILKCCIGVDRVSWMVPTRPREECVVCWSEIANCTTFHNEQDTLLFTQSEK